MVLATGMAIPDYQALMLPLLKVATDGESRVPLAADIIADDLALSQKEREELLPSGKQRILHNRIHWAKFYMSKAGLIKSPKRGVFVATDLGRDLIQTDPGQIDVGTLKAYPAFKDFYEASSSPSPEETVKTKALPSATTPEEQIEAAHATINAALQSDLLGRLLEQTPAFFEAVIVDLLVAMGYGGTHEKAALRLGKSGDGGIDGIIDEDRLGLDRIYIQAKRYALDSVVGRPAIQGFVGSLIGFGASKGVFVTTSSFSHHAAGYAEGLQQRVILIDGKRLAELMIEFGVGVRVSRVVEVKRLDEDFFEDAV